MYSNHIIFILSFIVIISYVIDITSHKLKIPSVFFMVLSGFVLKLLAIYFKFEVPYLNEIIPVLGTLGLIMIVLEGGLDIHFKPEKSRLIIKSFLTSLILIVLSVISTAFIFSFFFNTSLKLLIINSIPFAVISSAIAIPSVKGLPGMEREFVIYESTISDILGVMIFNYFITNSSFSVTNIFSFFSQFLLMIIISVVLVIFISKLFVKLNHHVKFLPIIALLFIIYSLAKIFHFSALLFVLLFGLFLNNSEIINIKKFKKFFNFENFNKIIPDFKNIVAEITFILKVFFFTFFGFSISIYDLIDLKSIGIASLIVVAVFLIRILYMKYILKFSVLPLAFIAPRGLITILLALSIPAQMKINELANGVLIWIVIFTLIILTVSIMINKNKVNTESNLSELFDTI